MVSCSLLCNKNISYDDRRIENVLSVSLNNKYMCMYVLIYVSDTVHHLYCGFYLCILKFPISS